MSRVPNSGESVSLPPQGAFSQQTPGSQTRQSPFYKLSARLKQTYDRLAQQGPTALPHAAPAAEPASKACAARTHSHHTPVSATVGCESPCSYDGTAPVGHAGPSKPRAAGSAAASSVRKAHAVYSGVEVDANPSALQAVVPPGAPAQQTQSHFHMMKTYSESAQLPSLRQSKLNASISQLNSMPRKERAPPSAYEEVAQRPQPVAASASAAARAPRVGGPLRAPASATTITTAARTSAVGKSPQQQQVENALCPQNRTALPPAIQHSRCGPNNHGFDDANNDYIIEIGEVWDRRYLVVKKLGRGSFGQVVEAFDQLKQARVAVKIIKNRSAFYKQALVEERVLKYLREMDPHGAKPIVGLLRSFHQQNHLCMVYELLGVNLYEVLRMTQFQGLHLNAVREIARQLLITLQFLNRRDLRIVHCDLKPENILVCDPASSTIKVIDFGSSCFENEKLYNYIQSRFYRSPEILLGLTYTCAIDSWSLGCVLMELLTGEPLFPGQSEGEMLAGMCKTLGPPPDYLLDLACPSTQTMLRHPEVIWGIKREKVALWFRRTSGGLAEDPSDVDHEIDPLGGQFELDMDDGSTSTASGRISSSGSNSGSSRRSPASDNCDAEDDQDEDGWVRPLPDNTSVAARASCYQSAPQPRPAGSRAPAAEKHRMQQRAPIPSHWTCTAQLPARSDHGRKSTSWGGSTHSLWHVIMRKMCQKELQIAEAAHQQAHGAAASASRRPPLLPGTLELTNVQSPPIPRTARPAPTASVAVNTDECGIAPEDWCETHPETVRQHGQLIATFTTRDGVDVFREGARNRQLHAPLCAPECRVTATLGHSLGDFKNFYLLIRRLLQYDPVARVTPEQALQSRFFRPCQESALNTMVTLVHRAHVAYVVPPRSVFQPPLPMAWSPAAPVASTPWQSHVLLARTTKAVNPAHLVIPQRLTRSAAAAAAAAGYPAMQ